MENRAGRKIKVGSGNVEYSCFIPAPLPPVNPQIQYDDEMIYLLSDTHFGHKNIFEYENRPFNNITLTPFVRHEELVLY